jgi:hypothetical protein
LGLKILICLFFKPTTYTLNSFKKFILF